MADISFDDLVPKKETDISFDDLVPSNTSEGVVQEFAEGAASGGTKLIQGVLETSALVPDYFGGTDYASDITEYFEEGRANLGIDPEGLAGAIGEVGVTVCHTWFSAARFVGAASKAGKIRNFCKTIRSSGNYRCGGCYQRYDYTRRFF